MSDKHAHYVNLDPDTTIVLGMTGSSQDGEWDSGRYTKYFWNVTRDGQAKASNGKEFTLSLWPEEQRALEDFGPAAGDLLEFRTVGKGKGKRVYIQKAGGSNTMVENLVEAAKRDVPGTTFLANPRPKLDVSYEDYMGAFWEHHAAVEAHLEDRLTVLGPVAVAHIATDSWRALQEAGVEIPFLSGPATLAETVEGTSEAAKPTGHRAWVAAVLRGADIHSDHFTAVLSYVVGEDVTLAELTEDQATHFANETDQGDAEKLRTLAELLEDPAPEPVNLPWEA